MPNFRSQSLFFRAVLVSIVWVTTDFSRLSAVLAQASSQPLLLSARKTDANVKTGVITLTGEVRINYPSQQIQTVSNQGTYYIKERRIVLSGNVYVLQKGNSLRGETITYFVDEGRFVALPQTNGQVEVIYLIQNPPSQNLPPVPAPFTKSKSQSSRGF